MCNSNIGTDQIGKKDNCIKLASKSSWAVSNAKWNKSKRLVKYACLAVVFFVLCLTIWDCGADLGAKVSWYLLTILMEILGLASLRDKIKSRQSVGGISGMTCLMLSMVYFTRLCYDICVGSVLHPGCRVFALSMEICSFLLVLDILRSVFATHRSTYEADLDVMKAWYLIPICWLIPLAIHMVCDSANRSILLFVMSSGINMDALALMPQVVMMAKAGGSVEVPVLNFVAAVGFARAGDMFNTLWFNQVSSNLGNIECFGYWMAGQLDEGASTLVVNWLQAVFAQAVQLILIADFLYHYFRANAWKSKKTEQINIMDVWALV